MGKEINEAIAEVKGPGFWMNGTEGRIRRIAKDLLDAGASKESVADAIREFWDIGRSEYGE